MQFFYYLHRHQQIMFRLRIVLLHNIIQCTVVKHFRNILWKTQMVKHLNGTVIIMLRKPVFSHGTQIISDAGQNSALINIIP